MRNIQKEFFERSLKRQGVVVVVNDLETKALIINNKDIKTSWSYRDILLPYEIKAEVGDIIHVGDKRFFICNKDEQYDIRNLYRCCENVHDVRFDYQNGTIKSVGLVTLAEEGITSLYDGSLLQLAKGMAILNIKHTATTEQIDVGDRFVLMNRPYKVIGITWGTQNLIKLELEKSAWNDDTDDRENGIIMNKRELDVVKEPEPEPEQPDIPTEPTEPDVPDVPDTPEEPEEPTYDIDAYGELGDWSLQTVESGTSLSFLNAEKDGYFLGGNKTIFKSDDKGVTWRKVATPSYSVKNMAFGQGENEDGVMEDRYAIIGASYLTGYSNDKGETWEFFTDGVTKVANDMKYIDGYFISVSTGRVGHSYEGEYYNEMEFNDTSFVGRTLDYVNGKWVICGTKGLIAILNDNYEPPMAGSDFTIVDTGVGSVSFARITYSKQLGLYVLVGTSGTIVTSPDLVTFTTVASSLTGYGGGVISFMDCIYANQMFIAIGTRKTIYTSRDGVNWESSYPCGTSTSISFNRITVDNEGKVFITLSDGTIATNQFTTI